MPTFTYKAINSKGETVKNKVEAPSKSALVKSLKDNHLAPIKIEEVAIGGGLNAPLHKKRKNKNAQELLELMKDVNTIEDFDLDKKKLFKDSVGKYVRKNSKIKRRDLLVFTENFYLLKKANFNNIHALNTIIKTTENRNLRKILEEMLRNVEAGENMYTTMEKYDYVFPYLYINMIKVGELSGSFISALEQAIKYLEDSEELNQRLKKILIPNIVQFVGLLILLFAGTIFAIPAIQAVFDQVGTTDKLPGITLWFSHVVDTLIQYWYIPTIIILGVVAAIIAYINTPQGRYNFHYFKYKMPIFGDLIFALDFLRFLKAIHLNLQNGMRIQESLEVSKNVCKNCVLLGVIEKSINNILIGKSWIEPIEKSGLASPMIIEMLNIGMRTDLTEMVGKLIEYMEIEINQIMDRIMAVLPQIVYTIVGLVLIFFVIVILVPCVQVYMGNFLFSAYDV